jgi:tetratricopeptide (TPR) repeat protein
MARILSNTNELAVDLLRMGDFVKIIARAQDYALYSSLMPGLDKKTQDQYYKQALEWFDFVIERNPLFSHDAYMGKIYALYLKGDMDQAKFVYEEMKKENNTDTFDRLKMLFS